MKLKHSFLSGVSRVRHISDTDICMTLVRHVSDIDTHIRQVFPCPILKITRVYVSVSVSVFVLHSPRHTIHSSLQLLLSKLLNKDSETY